MSYKLKLSSQNQITLPIALLEEIGLKSGQYIEIAKVDNYFVLRTFREVLKELDSLTLDLQLKTKKILEKNPELNLTKIIDHSLKNNYITKNIKDD